MAEEDVGLAVRIVARLRDENEHMRSLLEKACDSMECAEYCPFWLGDNKPCELQAVRRD